MDPILHKALSVARTGHEGLLAGFGIERYMEYGMAVPPSSYEWEERLTLRGNGIAELSRVRSLQDASGEPIGRFTTVIDRADVMEVIGLIQDTGLAETAPFFVETGDMRVRMTFVIGGVAVVKQLGVRDPERLAVLQPLLERLDQLEYFVRRSPACAVCTSMEMPLQLEVGLQEVPVTLRFHNPGTEPCWILHPRMLNRGNFNERCSFTYGYCLFDPGGGPPKPGEIIESPLLPERESGVQMIWLPPGASQESKMLTSVNFYRGGQYLARVVYSTYEGMDQIGGVRRVRGCAFSQEVIVKIG